MLTLSSSAHSNEFKPMKTPKPINSFFLKTNTDTGKSWNLKVKIFQAWKVMESGLGAGKSWKIKQIVAAF